jgi:hypothetical protein
MQHLAPASYRAVKLGALNTALQRVGIDPDLVQPLRVVHRSDAAPGLG